MGLCAGLELVRHLPARSCRTCGLTFCEGKDREGRPEGYAHVEFESKGDAVKVSEDHNESPIRIGGREVWIGFASPSPREGSPTSVLRAIKGHPKPSPTIFVVNVPYEATRDDIREALKHIGDVAAVRIGALP